MAMKKILLFRHAEEPADPEDSTWTPEGAERARRLAQMLPARYGTIDAVYAAAASKHSIRPILTVQPLADALQQRVIDDVGDQDYEVLAERLLSLQKHNRRRAAICCHHSHIPDFAATLGVQNPPAPWPALVFDGGRYG
jgi:phosphohistidine phosphatase SixA